MTKRTNKKSTAIILDEDTIPFLNALIGNQDRQIVVVCFGTTSISGDALGPQVGTLLKEKYNIPAFVYGTQENSINGKNMKDWISFIRLVHKDALFVSVDASLGAQSKIGQIILRTDGVCPAGVKGNCERFGDVGILAVVAQNATDPLSQLIAVSPLYIDKIANKLAFVLAKALCGCNFYSAEYGKFECKNEPV